RAKAAFDRVRARWPAWMPRFSTLLAAAASFTLALLVVVAAYPSEAIYPWTRSLTARVFEGAVNEVSSRPNTWFGLSNVLVLPDQDLGVAEKLKALSDAKDPDRVTLSLRGRDLAGAVFDGVDLRQADFTGAVLKGTSLQRANLARARFACGGTIGRVNSLS